MRISRIRLSRKLSPQDPRRGRTSTSSFGQPGSQERKFAPVAQPASRSPEFRRGTRKVQAEFPPSYPTMLSLRLLGSTGITPLPGYYGPVRLPTSPVLRLCIPEQRTARGGASQVPRPICRGALSPLTPESPAGALVQDFPADTGFIQSGGLATPIGVTRPIRVYLRYGSPLRSNQASAVEITLHPRWSSYMYSGLLTW